MVTELIYLLQVKPADMSQLLIAMHTQAFAGEPAAVAALAVPLAAIKISLRGAFSIAALANPQSADAPGNIAYSKLLKEKPPPPSEHRSIRRQMAHSSFGSLREPLTHGVPVTTRPL